jgi:Immunoglobulin domain
MKNTSLLLALFLLVASNAAAVSWTSSPPATVASGQSYSISASHSYAATTVLVFIFKNGAQVAGNNAGGPGTYPITANTSCSSTDTGSQTVIYRADGRHLSGANNILDASATASTVIVPDAQYQASVTISPSTGTVYVGDSSIEFTASGGSGTIDYTWGGAASSTGNPKRPTFNTVGNDITVTVYNPANTPYLVSNTAYALITVKPLDPQIVTIHPPTNPIYADDNVGFGVSGGSGTINYTWGLDAAGSTGSGISVIAPAAGQQVSVSVYNPANGHYAQSNTETATITVSQRPHVHNYSVYDHTESSSWSYGTWSAWSTSFVPSNNNCDVYGTQSRSRTNTRTLTPYYRCNNSDGRCPTPSNTDSGSSTTESPQETESAQVGPGTIHNFVYDSTSYGPWSYGTWSDWTGWNPSVHYYSESGTQSRSRTNTRSVTVTNKCSRCSTTQTGSTSTETASEPESRLIPHGDLFYSQTVAISPKTPSVSPSATQTFSATGGNTSYTWSCSSGTISGSGSSITWTAPATAGTYTVTATDAGAPNYQSSSDPATITVVASKPTITLQPAPQIAAAGGNASFSTTATGTGTLTYQWRKNGNNISDGGNISGATTATLTLTGVVAADASNYSVAVSNASGATPSDAVALAIITVQPANVTVSAGGQAAFTVAATGGTFTYQWYKDNVVISGANAIPYTIANAQAANQGNYKVRVSILGAYKDSNNASLTVTALDPNADSDGDGVINSVELALGLNPLDPNDVKVDTYEYDKNNQINKGPGGRYPNKDAEGNIQEVRQ